MVAAAVACFDVQMLAERGKSRFDLNFDLIRARVVPEREQAFNTRLGYSNTAGELRFL
jgi:hypothetical protein